MIKVTCPNCDETKHFPEHYTGTTVACPGCEKDFYLSSEGNAEKEEPTKEEPEKDSHETDQRKEKAQKTDKKGKDERIISCPACGNDVSVHADSCPHCGRPTPSERNAEVQTIEQTGKKWKAMQLIGGIGVPIGFCLFCSGIPVALAENGDNVGLLSLGFLILIGAGGLFLYGRVGGWWHHG